MSEHEKKDAGLPYELHLSDGSIRGAILAHLRELGYEPTPGSLRIYGYGDAERETELSGFQGHVQVAEVRRNKVSDD